MSSHLSVLCAHYLSGMGLSFALSLHRNLAPLDKANVRPTIAPPLPEAASPSLLPQLMSSSELSPVEEGCWHFLLSENLPSLRQSQVRFFVHN